MRQVNDYKVVNAVNFSLLQTVTMSPFKEHYIIMSSKHNILATALLDKHPDVMWWFSVGLSLWGNFNIEQTFLRSPLPPSAAILWMNIIFAHNVCSLDKLTF